MNLLVNYAMEKECDLCKKNQEIRMDKILEGKKLQYLWRRNIFRRK